MKVRIGKSTSRPSKLGIVASLLLLVLGVAGTAGASAPFIGDPFIIAAGPSDQTHPAVAYNSQRQQFLVAWEIGSGWFQYAQFTKDGNLAWDPPVISIAQGERPAVAYNNAVDQYLLVWQLDSGSGYDIKAMRLQGDGLHLPGGSIIDVSVRPWHQRNPAVAVSSHPNFLDYLVVWEDVDPTWVPQHWQIWAQRVADTSGSGSGGGELIGANFSVATKEQNSEPDVAYNLNMNEYLVVYSREPAGGGGKGVYGQRVTGGGVSLAERAIDDTANDQHSPTVAAYHLNHNTPYLVAYTDHRTDSAGDVRARLVDKQGQWQDLVDIASMPGRPEQEPDIAGNEALGGYTVVWSQTDNDWDIYTRRVRDDGTAEPAFNLSLFGLAAVPCHEQAPAVAGGSPVNFVVWQDNCLGGSGSWSIAGRLLGYRVYLPVTLRAFR